MQRIYRYKPQNKQYLQCFLSNETTIQQHSKPNMTSRNQLYTELSIPNILMVFFLCKLAVLFA